LPDRGQQLLERVSSPEANLFEERISASVGARIPKLGAIGRRPAMRFQLDRNCLSHQDDAGRFFDPEKARSGAPGIEGVELLYASETC